MFLCWFWNTFLKSARSYSWTISSLSEKLKKHIKKMREVWNEDSNNYFVKFIISGVKNYQLVTKLSLQEDGLYSW